MAEAYCVKCKAKREVKNPQKITMKNGKPALSGGGRVCGTKRSKIGAAPTFSTQTRAPAGEGGGSLRFRLHRCGTFGPRPWAARPAGPARGP